MASGADVRLLRGTLASSADSQGTSHERVEGLCHEPSRFQVCREGQISFYTGDIRTCRPLVSGDLLSHLLTRTLVGGPGTCVVTALQLLLEVAGWGLKAEESRCQGRTCARLDCSSEISELTFAVP